MRKVGRCVHSTLPRGQLTNVISHFYSISDSLGNIVSDREGVAIFKLKDKQVKLTGPHVRTCAVKSCPWSNSVPHACLHVSNIAPDMVSSLFQSVVGRGFAIHKNEDDLGLGGMSDSLDNGHTGAKIAGGPIALAR